MFQIEKKPCLTIKNYISYSRKTGYFPKGLTHDFGQKLEMMFGDVRERKEAVLHDKIICVFI